MLIDIDESKILQNESLNNSFKSASLKDINENCKILNTKFYGTLWIAEIHYTSNG